MEFKIEKIDPEKLPLYEIFVGDGDDTGISLISLVDKPAIGVKGMAFSDASVMSFKKEEDKQIIVGPALIPDIKIKREDENGNQYFVKFSKETIQKMVEKFNRYGSNRRINAQHTERMVDAFIVEDWIVEDPLYDKSRKYGFEVPVGTYMIKVKVDDKDFWENEVKGEAMYGFSIEGLLSQMLVSLSEIPNYWEMEDNKEYETIDEFIDDLSITELCHIFEVFDGCSCHSGEGTHHQEFAIEDLLKDFKRKQKPVLSGLSPEAKSNIADAAKKASTIIKRGLVKSQPGIIHPNCKCQFEFNDNFTNMDFRKSAPYIGKDGKPYPCVLCDEAESQWNGRGYFQDVFGNRYTKISTFPYFVKQDA